ncbi:MAG: efflux RND transporter periplasmic adaptor subunit, partial [Sarcina sp.]
KQAEMMQIDLYTIPGKEKVYLSGKITPKQSESFSLDPAFSAIEKISVNDGQDVKKGDVLFNMKNTENITQIEGLKRQLAKKKTELSKVPSEDSETKNIIKSEIEELNGQISDLNKNTYKTIYAPFAGRVHLPKQATNSQEGVSNAIVVLETVDYHINTQVNEMELLKLKEEQEVTINITPSKATTKGKIKSVLKRPIDGGDLQGSYDGGGASFSNYPVLIEAEDQKDFVNGFGVEIVAEFGTPHHKIPLEAVLNEGGKTYIYKVVNDIAKKVEVKIKESNEKMHVISEGVNENDTLVRDASNPNIVDGQNIYTDAK